MTAMNLIVQENRGAAYLVSDTAHYANDGTVGGFARKVFTVNIPDGSHVAIATTGMRTKGRWAERISAIPASTLSDFLAQLPQSHQAMEVELIAKGVPARSACSTFAAVIGAYDARAGKVLGFVLGNQRYPFSDDTTKPPYRPYTLQPARMHLTRYLGHPFQASIDPCNGRLWNPVTDAEALIEAQRADDFGIEPNVFAGVGGQAVLTKISAAGVEHTIITGWGDLPGKRIRDVDPKRWQSRLMRFAQKRWDMPVVAISLDEMDGKSAAA